MLHAPRPLLILSLHRQNRTLDPPHEGHGSGAVSREVAALNGIEQPAQQVGGLPALAAVHVTTVTVGWTETATPRPALRHLPDLAPPPPAHGAEHAVRGGSDRA